MDDNPFNFADDPQFDALLDEALSPDSIPGGIPVGLNDRILAATHASLASSRPAVIARVGFFASVSFKRIAAAVLLAGGVGLAILIANSQNTPAPTDNPAIVQDDHKKLEQLAADVESSTVRDTFVMADTTLDQRIDQLKSRTTEADLAAAVENWRAVGDSLEAALDAMDNEPDNG